MAGHAVPLNIPLHFQPASGAGPSSAARGPTIPCDWRTRWHSPCDDRMSSRAASSSSARVTTKVAAGSREREESGRAAQGAPEGFNRGDDDDDAWPDTDLQRWSTCLAVWEAQQEQTGSMETPSRGLTGVDPSSYTTAANSNEDSNDANGDSAGSSAGAKRRTTTAIGSTGSGHRVALGTQDGVVWIFEEALGHVVPAPLMTPTASSRKVSSASRTSIASPSSPTSFSAQHRPRHRSDMDSVGSPTTAVIDTTDVMAATSPRKNARRKDAEEKLEEQWHAGHESHSMMGGMMEALGLQDGYSHANHQRSHNHSRISSAAMTPSSSRTHRSSSVHSKKHPSRTSLTDPERPSPSITESDATDKAFEPSFDATRSHAEGGLMHAFGMNSKRQSASGAGASDPEALKGVSRTSDESARAMHEAAKRSTRRVGTLQPILSVQCSSSAPVAALRTARPSSKPDVLAILQGNGILTLCSLGEKLELREIDLKDAKVPEAVPGGRAGSQPAGLASPMKKLAALRSQAGSPGPNGTRSRAASTTGHLDAGLSMPKASHYSAMHLVKDMRGNNTSILLCYDESKRRNAFIDCVTGQALAIETITDMSQTPPVGKLAHEGDDAELYYIDDAGYLVLQTIRLTHTSEKGATQQPKQQAPSQLLPPGPDNRFAPLNSASAFLRREGFSRPASKAPSIAESAEDHAGKTELGNAGIESSCVGLLSLDGQIFATWSRAGLSLARRVGDSLVALSCLDRPGIVDVHADGSNLTLLLQDGVEVLDISSTGELEPLGSPIFTLAGNAGESIAVLDGCPTSPLSCLRTEDNRLLIRSDKATVWRGTAAHDDTNHPRITASLPFSMERIVLALTSGHLVLSSLGDLVAGKLPSPKKGAYRHFGVVTLLQTATNPRTNAKHVLGGTEEGDVIVWDANTLEHQRHFSTLTSPIVAFVALGNQDNALRLQGCVACVSADGTVAILLLDGLKDLYVIPGRDAPLSLLAVRSNDLLLFYDDGRARVWDMASLELRRSIGSDQALALLDDGRGWWSRHPIGPSYLRREKGAAGVLSSVPTSRASMGGTVTADIRRAVEAASRMVAPLNSGVSSARQLVQSTKSGDDAVDDLDPAISSKALLKEASLPSLSIPTARRALTTLRPLLRGLLPLGLSAEGDTLCHKLLDIECAKEHVWIGSGTITEPGLLALYANCSAREILSISNTITSTRLVASTAMLLVLSNIAELQEVCQEIIILLGTLPNLVGDSFRSPSLSVLAEYLVDPISEIKDAAQMLFVSTLEAVHQDELETLCAQYSDKLPSRGNETAEAPKALLLLGLVAAQRYTDLSPILLKDIANSIFVYLNQEDHPQRQAVGIVLCDRGFGIFQHYFDAMEVVRCLFSLSSITKDGAQPLGGNASAPTQLPASEPAGGHPAFSSSAPSAEVLENRDLGRAAVLRIAEENTPLFMTTLSLDILHARSPAHCSATMRLVALMVRRKPHILYPNLPRLAEAVVKSLDPTITAMRSVVHRSATIIISELITTYPTIAFHKESQRLAVGTFEGAIIVYDLKTATRLYVLEAHKASLNGLAFSQDGRRLVSLCLRDGMVKVWKTGTGFRSLFAFGSAPKQMSSLLRGSDSAAAGHEADNKGGSTGSATAVQPTPHPSTRQGGTTPYKSFEFGHVAGAALASGHVPSATAAGSFSISGPGGSQSTSDAAIMNDLNLVRFDWLGERNVKIRISDASMVFDIA